MRRRRVHTTKRWVELLDVNSRHVRHVNCKTHRFICFSVKLKVRCYQLISIGLRQYISCVRKVEADDADDLHLVETLAAFFNTAWWMKKSRFGELFHITWTSGCWKFYMINVYIYVLTPDSVELFLGFHCLSDASKWSGYGHFGQELLGAFAEFTRMLNNVYIITYLEPANTHENDILPSF